uniref:Matrix protein n=1 Tax=Vinca chlorotic spot virus TaxID=3076770 RepID=A0AA96KEG1_9RHAB|nr:matrix protein [Vinca chlorotic spot virus]
MAGTCTVMSIRSRITVKGPTRLIISPETITEIIKTLHTIKVNPTDASGNEITGEWSKMLAEVAQLSKPQISGPFLSKDLEKGNIYSLNMIIGGVLDAKDNCSGRIMTLRTGSLYDTPHYTINGASEPVIKLEGHSITIQASIATVKRQISLCEKHINQYTILPKVPINPPPARPSTQDNH